MMGAPTRRALAALAVGSFLLAFACSSAVASGGKTTNTGNWVGVAQTVVVATDSTGKISGNPRVFTQWGANGTGPVTLKVPMSSAGFRNLSGFGTAPIKDGFAVWNLQLNGPTHERSVAHFPVAKLPLTVSAAYELNGKKVDAKDIVGKSGELKVTYVIKNVTTKPTKVHFSNVLGKQETTTVKAPVPIAAIVDVTVPPSFTNLKGPGASASGNGNGTSSASWTLFLFNPLGGVKQSVTYQAHVTDAVVPSATVEAAPLAPHSGKPLPAISEPGAPAIPTVTLGSKLATLQTRLQAKLQLLAAKASLALAKLRQVEMRAATTASDDGAKLGVEIASLSSSLQTLSTHAGAGAAGLSRAAAEAHTLAGQMGTVAGGLATLATDAAAHVRKGRQVEARLHALPQSVKGTREYRLLQAAVVDLQARLAAHAARLALAALQTKRLEARMLVHAAVLAQLSTTANALQSSALAASSELSGPVLSATQQFSADAAQKATTIANAAAPPRGHRSSKAIQPRQVGGGARVDKAFAQLDTAITSAADKVDVDYAYLKALDQRAAESRLPAGNAQGATAEAGAFVYSISGANNTAHQTHLAIFIGIFALIIGIGFGIGLYRIRRGMPSSLKPPKSAKAAASA